MSDTFLSKKLEIDDAPAEISIDEQGEELGNGWHRYIPLVDVLYETNFMIHAPHEMEDETIVPAMMEFHAHGAKNPETNRVFSTIITMALTVPQLRQIASFVEMVLRDIDHGK